MEKLNSEFRKDYIGLAYKEVISKTLANSCVYEKEQKADLPNPPMFVINNLELTLVKFGVLLNQYLGLIDADNKEDAKNVAVDSTVCNLLALYDEYKGEHFIYELENNEEYDLLMVDWYDFCDRIDFYVGELVKEKNGSELDRLSRTLDMQTTPETMQSQLENLKSLMEQSANFEPKATKTDEEFCKEQGIDLQEFLALREKTNPIQKTTRKPRTTKK